jgi:aspartate-semialdehyde dehydrogenase
MKTAILGASGLVGRTMLGLLEKTAWVQEDPLLLVSARSAGTRLPFRGRELVCQEVQPGSFRDVRLALFSAGGAVSRQWGPVASEAGCLVVDNSSAFRMEPQVPLVVPEINGHMLTEVGAGGRGAIIANPNCSTIQIAMALAPLEDAFGLDEVQVTTLQAVSGAGQAAVAELVRQQGNLAAAGPSATFPRAMAGNVIPAIGSEDEGGFFEEETKVHRELRKILGREQDLAVACTATRVPVINGHSASVRAVCRRPVTMAEVLGAMADRPGLEFTADPLDYLTPLEISGRNAVHVGRLRPDPSCDRALLMWVVADNLLKGAAWNAVQIGARFAGEESA